MGFTLRFIKTTPLLPYLFGFAPAINFAGVFIAHIEDFKANSGDFVMYGLNPNVYSIFDLLGLKSILRVGALRRQGFKVRMFNKTQMLNNVQKFKFITNALLLQNPCYGQYGI